MFIDSLQYFKASAHLISCFILPGIKWDKIPITLLQMGENWVQGK